MAAHFQVGIEQIVFLVGFLGVALQLLQNQVVAPLLADLGDGHHTELKRAGVRVVLQDRPTQPEDVIIENVRVPGKRCRQFGLAAEQFTVPDRKMLLPDQIRIGTDGVIRDDQRGLDRIDEKQANIIGHHVGHGLDGQMIVILQPAAVDIVAVEP